MSASTRMRQDDGSAVVEFTVLAMLMLVPIVYLVIALGRIQAAEFAAQGAAREAGRAFVTGQDDASSAARADAAASIAFTDQGFRAASHRGIDIACDSTPCLTPDGRVTVHATVEVVLPGVPAVLDRVIPARITVTATQVTAVDRFRVAGATP